MSILENHGTVAYFDYLAYSFHEWHLLLRNRSSCIDRFKLLSTAGGLFSSSLRSCLKHLHHLGGEHTHLEGNLELVAFFFPYHGLCATFYEIPWFKFVNRVTTKFLKN